MRAVDLIKAATVRKRGPAVPASLLKEIKAVCEHNDSAPAIHRVPSEAVLKMLCDAGIQCATLHTLQVICRERLGRKSWARK